MDSDRLPLFILQYDAKDIETLTKHVNGEDEVGRSLSLIGCSSSGELSSITPFTENNRILL